MERLGSVSLPALQQYLNFARSEGLDLRAALDAAGLSDAQLQQDGARISGESFQRLLLQLLQQSGDPLFGLRSGGHVQPGSYSALGYIVMSCATLGEAMEKIAPYEKLVGDMGVTTLERQGNQVLVNWHCNFVLPEVRRHMIDNVLMSWFKFAQWLANVDFGPAAVWLEQRAPAAQVKKDYQALYQCPVLFEQERNCLVIDRSYLSLPLRQPNQALKKTLEAHAHSQLVSLPDSHSRLSIKVKELIALQLKQGKTGKDWVAAQLDLNGRTLQRQLQQEGTRYQLLLDQVRQALAQDYLNRSELSIPQIAEALGFAEPRSFHRRFKDWTGVTPAEFRTRAGR